MVAERELNVSVRDSVFDPNSRPPSGGGTVQIKSKGSRTLYKVWIYLEGGDLPYVRSVRYELHPTFKNRFRTVERDLYNQNCQLIIWTWGLFDVRAEITDKTGNVYEVMHSLSYDRQLKAAGIEFKEEDDDPGGGSSRAKLKRSA